MITRPLTLSAVTLTAGVGLALGAWSPASAATPERFPVEFHNADSVDCGAFQDNFVDDFEGDAALFFDAGSEPSLLVIHWSHTSTDVNSVTGLTMHEHGHFTETIDLVTGTDTLTGNQEVGNRPGLGLVVQDTGRQVFDAAGDLLFFAGGTKHSQVLSGDAPFCVRLA